MISATSDSTAVTMSAVATWSLVTTVSRRSRDSASAGNASSASKAIVRRRPWPSFWWRSPEGAVAAALAGRRACPEALAFLAVLALLAFDFGFAGVLVFAL